MKTLPVFEVTIVRRDPSKSSNKSGTIYHVAALDDILARGAAIAKDLQGYDENGEDAPEETLYCNTVFQFHVIIAE